MGSSCSSQLYVHSGNDISLEDFSTYQIIGHGEFGQVHLGVHHGTRKLLAVKQIDLSRIWESGMKSTMIHNELNALKMLGTHPFITELAFTTIHQSLCFVGLSLVSGGCLRNLMMSVQFCEQSVAFIIACMDSALCYIHSRGILHRDIKPANIVLDSHGYPCLVDFGISFIRSRDDMIHRRPLTCRMTSGTEAYCAPELLTTSHEHGIESEYWSLGIMAYEMLFGHRPFRRKVHKTFVKYIQKRRNRAERAAEQVASIGSFGTYDTAAALSYSDKCDGKSSSARTMYVSRSNRQISFSRQSSGSVNALTGWSEKAREKFEKFEESDLQSQQQSQSSLSATAGRGSIHHDNCEKELPTEGEEAKDGIGNGVSVVQYFDMEEEDDIESLKQCIIPIPAFTNRHKPVSDSLKSFLRGILDVRLQCRVGGEDNPLRDHPWIKECELPTTEDLERKIFTPPSVIVQAVFRHTQTGSMSPDYSCRQQFVPVERGYVTALKRYVGCKVSHPLSPRIKQIHSEIGEYNYVARKFRKS